MPMRAKHGLCFVGVVCAFVASAESPSQPKPAPTENALVATIGKAVATHPMVGAARANRVGSDAGYDAARWQYYPSPSISIERGSNEALSRTTNTTLRLQQSLWAGGRIDSSVDAALHTVQLSGVAVFEAKTNVALRTLEVWQALLTSFGRRQVAQRDLERLQLFADMIGRRVERDVSANVETVLMRSRLTQVQSDLLAYTSAQATAEQRLAQWVGEPGVMADLNDRKLLEILQNVPEPLPAHMPVEMLSAVDKQPALLRNGVELALAQDEVRQRKASAWPNIYMRLDRQFTDVGSGGIDVRSADTKLYVGLEYSPGPGLSLRSHVEAAQSKIAALQQDRQSIRQDLLDRVNTDLREHTTNAARLIHSKVTVQAAKEVLDAYTRLFVVGRRGWLDVLNAARELSLAEQILSDLHAQQVVGIYRLQMHQCLFNWQNGDALGQSRFER